jgi:hypothetical protein
MTLTRTRLLRIGFYGGTGLILLCVLLHPYSRQSIFGPRIGDEPLWATSTKPCQRLIPRIILQSSPSPNPAVDT